MTGGWSDPKVLMEEVTVQSGLEGQVRLFNKRAHDEQVACPVGTHLFLDPRQAMV